jgi:Trypsin
LIAHRAPAVALIGAALLSSRTSGAILQGTEDAADPAAILVIAKSADGSTLRCTGAVVASRTVITAAHCVVPQAVGLGATFSLFLGADARGVEPDDARTIAVTRVESDPEFDLDALSNGHDLAALHVDAPLGVAPLPLATGRPAGDSDELRLVGYGVASPTDVSGATAFVRRQARVQVAEVTPGLFTVPAGQGPCEGDSGGPGLADNPAGERLVALTSYTQSGCGEGAMLTDLTAYLPLVETWIAGDAMPAPGSSSGCEVEHRATASRSDFGLARFAMCLLLISGARRRRRRAAS